MGQQQILILILVSIIIALAAWMGVHFVQHEKLVFEETAHEQAMLDMASEAQLWIKKSSSMGGGGGSFKGISFNDIPCPLDELKGNNTQCINENGNEKYQLINQTNSDHMTIISSIKDRQTIHTAMMAVHRDSVVWVVRW